MHKYDVLTESQSQTVSDLIDSVRAFQMTEFFDSIAVTAARKSVLVQLDDLKGEFAEVHKEASEYWNSECPEDDPEPAAGYWNSLFDVFCALYSFENATTFERVSSSTQAALEGLSDLESYTKESIEEWMHIRIGDVHSEMV